MSASFYVLNMLRKAATDNIKSVPFEMMKFDAMGNHNGHVDIDDVRIIANKVGQEIGLGDIADKAVEVGAEVLDTVKDTVTVAGDVIVDAGKAILEFVTDWF